MSNIIRYLSKRKKIGIVTIISKNYGNRLQNYALQEYLKKLGYKAYTIPYHMDRKTLIKEAIKLLLIHMSEYFRNRWVWENFNRKYINGTLVKHSDTYINQKCDYFIAGSDQIWNPLFWINTEREFLTSYDEEKRIAYAASIGIDQLPEDCLDRYRRYFNGIPFISVRENRAAEIIYTLTGKKVPVVIDPTMLLTREEWVTRLRPCKQKAPKRYVLKYILGTKKEEYESYIDESAAKEGLEVVDLLDENGFGKRSIGPLEFVSYIANSERTYVDSFHGAVFSILFMRPFVVFERPYEEGAGLMTSRLNTLLSTFGLKGRMVKDLVQLKRMDHNCDFSMVEDILTVKRKEALDFLSKALT